MTGARQRSAVSPRTEYTTESPENSQDRALALHDLGFNVFPLPYSKKTPSYKWGGLRNTRLTRQDVELAFAGKPYNIGIMMGRTSGGLAVIDCDNDEAFGAVMDSFQQAAIPIWAVETARGGHLYIRVNGELKSAKAARVRAGSRVWVDCAKVENFSPEVDLRGAGSYVVGAGSKHPDEKTRYELISGSWDCPPPIVTLDQLRKALPGFPLKISSTRETPLYRTARLLAAETPVGTRNDDLYLATRDSMDSGLPEHQIRAILSDKAIAVGLPPNQAANTIESGIKGHHRNGKEKRPSGAIGRLSSPFADMAREAVSRAIAEGRLRPQTQAIDTAILEEHLERASLDNPHRAQSPQGLREALKQGSKLVWRASCRELALACGVTPNGANNSTKRLMKAGLIELTYPDKENGFKYSIGSNLSLMVQDDTLPATQGKMGNGVSFCSTKKHHLIALCPDAFHSGCLGRNSAVILAVLDTEQGKTAEDIARDTGLTASQVKASLKRLYRSGREKILQRQIAKERLLVSREKASPIQREGDKKRRQAYHWKLIYGLDSGLGDALSHNADYSGTLGTMDKRKAQIEAQRRQVIMQRIGKATGQLERWKLEHPELVGGTGAIRFSKSRQPRKASKPSARLEALTRGAIQPAPPTAKQAEKIPQGKRITCRQCGKWEAHAANGFCRYCQSGF